jgi:hypothetical protein
VRDAPAAARGRASAARRGAHARRRVRTAAARARRRPRERMSAAAARGGVHDARPRDSREQRRATCARATCAHRVRTAAGGKVLTTQTVSFVLGGLERE